MCCMIVVWGLSREWACIYILVISLSGVGALVEYLVFCLREGFWWFLCWRWLFIWAQVSECGLLWLSDRIRTALLFVMVLPWF